MDGRWMRHFQLRQLQAAGLTPDALDDEFTFMVAKWLELDPLPLDWTEDGIAVVSIIGPLYKGRSPFVSNYRAIGDALSKLIAAPPRAVVLKIDSPGGMVDGLQGVTDQVAELAESTLVVAHVDGCCCSAAYRIASQAGSIFATADSEIGSIGTCWQLIDYSKAFEQAGLESVLLSTGPFKGLGAIGEPITEEHRAFLQGVTDDINGSMLADVQAGRDMTDEQIAAVSDGRFWLAADAVGLSLIDGVESLDVVLEAVRSQTERVPGMAKATLTTDGAAAEESTESKPAETPTESKPTETAAGESTESKPAETPAESKPSERTLADYMEAFGDAEGAKMFRDGVAWEEAAAQTLADVRGQLQDTRSELALANTRLKELAGENAALDIQADEPKKTVSFSEAARAGRKTSAKK
jgi:signal peptide peptidase SppA